MIDRSQISLSATPTISVVIISRNEGTELAATFENICQTLPADRREMIVVDDASTDGSTSFLQDHPEVKLLRAEGIGVARARNLGAANATGEIVLFADAHVRAPQGWYVPIVEALRRPAVGAVAPGVSSFNEPARCGYGLAFTGPDLHTTWLRRGDNLPHEVPILPGCFLALRRETFVGIGGYDPCMHQLGGNDNEISCRLWLLGYELLVIPEVTTSHLFRTVTPYASSWASVVHNRLRMAFVHFDSGRVTRVVNALRRYDAFPAAIALMLEHDVHSRRAQVTGMRHFDADWYCRRFSQPC